MGCACLTLPQSDPLEEVRRMAHDALDQWIDTLAPLFEQQKPPTLMELSAHMTGTRGAFLGGCLQALTQELYRHHRQADCPGCGKRLTAKRMDRKTARCLITTTVPSISIQSRKPNTVKPWKPSSGWKPPWHACLRTGRPR